MDHVFSVDFKFDDGKVGHTKIIINTECDHEFFLWRCALGEAYQYAEHENAELIQMIRLS